VPRKVSVVIERDEHGCYAYCPELPGCHTQGPTLEAAIERIKEAIDLYLETLSTGEIESCLSRDILTTSIEVRVA
jgi:predicted RNase H-like HicB family nuclease